MRKLLGSFLTSGLASGLFLPLLFSCGSGEPGGIGPQGVYQRRGVFRRLGRARDWLFELSIADPVKPVFIGAFMEAA